MKNILQAFGMAMCIAFVSTTAFAQSGDDAISKYFNQYMDDDRFDMVYISPKMFEMLAKIDIEIEDEEIDDEVMDIVKELKGLRVLSYEGTEAPGFYKDAKGKINTNTYEELIAARDGNENVHISAKSAGDIVNELLVLVGGDDEFVLLSFVGNIDLKKVGKIASMMDINGAHHLRKLDDHKDKNSREHRP